MACFDIRLERIAADESEQRRAEHVEREKHKEELAARFAAETESRLQLEAQLADADAENAEQLRIASEQAARVKIVEHGTQVRYHTFGLISLSFE